jgi:hypothetical protein
LFGKDSVSAFIINGKKTHRKSIDSLGVKQSISEVRRCLDPNAQEFRTKGKHKYLMPLDKDMSAKIAPLAKPYPKRVKKQDSEYPSELGGAVPTDTLHHAGIEP